MTTDITQNQTAPEALVYADKITFVDQLAQIVIGPHVSKLTFGIDTVQGVMPTPVVTIAIPTVSLIHLVQQVTELISDSTTQDGIKNQVNAYLSSLPSRSKS